MGVVVGVDVEAKGALIVTNPDLAEMSDRPMQPESQPIGGPSSSNDDVLVNDSRDDTDVSSMIMIEPLDKMTRGSKFVQTKSVELLYISCENDNEHDGRIV